MLLAQGVEKLLAWVSARQCDVFLMSEHFDFCCSLKYLENFWNEQSCKESLELAIMLKLCSAQTLPVLARCLCCVRHSELAVSFARVKQLRPDYLMTGVGGPPVVPYQQSAFSDAKQREDRKARQEHRSHRSPAQATILQPHQFLRHAILIV
ncbi:hypothetical protein PSPO01_02040 [Paraphaeosphaeria sporulosa]